MVHVIHPVLDALVVLDETVVVVPVMDVALLVVLDVLQDVAEVAV